MTDPTAGPDEPNPDEPDSSDDALTVDRILAAAGADTALAGLPDKDSQASRLVALAHMHYELVAGDDGPPLRHLTHRPRDRPQPPGPLRAPGAARGPLLPHLPTGTRRHRPHRRPRRARSPSRTHRPRLGRPAVARAGEQSIVVDLGDVDGRAVLVGPGGWRITDRSPVLFRRSRLTGPLPTPVPGGSLEPLAELLNVDDDRFRLLVAWLVAALIPDIPHPILALFGEQGTAKSTAARILVGLVDPSPAPLRTPPRELRSWAASAYASWVVALDNVSTIPAWFSDTLCKAVTGDGVVERALHTDDDLNILTFRRVVAMTSIDAGALAGDLAERLLAVELDPIPPDKRRSDAQVTAAYAVARPAVLGALLDLLAVVLDELPRVQLAELPRMADFAKVLAALDTTQGWDPCRLRGGRRRDRSRGPRLRPRCRRGPRARRDRRRVAGHRYRVARPAQPRASTQVLAPESPGALKRLAPALRAGWGVTVTWPTRGQVRTLTIRGPEAPEEVELANA